ncbi:hypothetical protein [Methylocystis sp.]|uniref:hypothetical protein n=1 Tax=Methylocystis sp. TaxID=1911079 RepID=UPI003DA3F5B6
MLKRGGLFSPVTCKLDRAIRPLLSSVPPQGRRDKYVRARVEIAAAIKLHHFEKAIEAQEAPGKVDRALYPLLFVTAQFFASTRRFAGGAHVGVRLSHRLKDCTFWNALEG